MSLEKKHSTTERLYFTVALLIGILAIFSLFGRHINITTPVPDYAIVYADEQNQIYYAPPYILGNKYPPTLEPDILKAHTVADSNANHYQPDQECIDLGYFKEQDTLNHIIMVKLGWSEPKQSRWNPDGSWNF